MLRAAWRCRCPGRSFSSARQVWRWGGESAPAAVAAPGASAVACGGGHSAFVAQGRLQSFGANNCGQLGRSGEDAQPGPVELVAPDGHRPPVQLVALGARHSAAITEGGILWTWGYGGSFWYGAGGLGLGKRSEVSSPEMVMSFVNQGVEVAQVACGGLHTLVLDQDGKVHSTGQGGFGRLGRGGVASRGDEYDFHEIVFFSKTTDSIMNPGEEPAIVKVDAGREFSAAMSLHGELWVWGRNDYGQLGMGFEVMKDRNFCMQYPFLMRTLPMEGHVIRDFACGETHMVMVTTAGAIYEWGNRQYFEPTAITLPSRYQEGIKGVWKVAAGENCSFALTQDGELYSWGRRSTGCLASGIGDEEVRRPTLVPPETFGNQRVLDIAVGKQCCLAITEP
ncbi:unnamed protein product [Effrenium voratum]|uniref:RCC1-like domain-containing protein n=1 Tax=Effrenium voratum TaxID=2562239 RepID=A0AA36JD69_9DINO|nr:unnamed protein product [Effrenium voratum]